MRHKNLFKIAMLFVFAMITVTTLKAQTLSAGDIAIIGVSVDDEEVLLVALSNIPSGESVFFTDDEWGGSSFNTGEGFYEWITPAVSAGTTFTLTKTSTTAGGTITQKAGSMTFSNSGDGFYLYQTSTNVYNTGTYSVLGFAGEDSGDAGTLTGTGLVIGTNAIYFGGDNGIYNGARVGNDKAGYLALIYDNTNWATSGSSQTFDSTDFTIGSNPLVTFDTATSTVIETDATFNVSIPVTVSNYDGNQIDISIAASGTADAADYTLNSANLTFIADGSQNVSLDINDDADTDTETVILTITETSSVTGLIISQATHTVTIIDDEVAPGISLPYTIDFTSVDPFANNWTAQNIAGSSTWSYTNGTGVNMNAFSDGCTAEDWLISPAFNLDTAANEILSYDFSQQYGSTAIEIYYSNDYIGTGDPNTATWTLIESVAAQSSGSTFAEISSANLTALQGVAGTNVHIAFKYDTTADCSNWIVENFTLETASLAPNVTFDAETSSETETNATFTSANIPITVSNYSGTQIDINVSVTGGTAEAGDYTFTSPTALSFTAEGTQNITVDINDDADTDNETVILTITETSSVTGLTISEATHTLSITDDEAPSFLVEDFSNSDISGSYGDGNFVGNNGVTWSYIESRDENGDANGVGIDGKALMLRESSLDSKVTSGTVSGGIGNFSVKLYKGFTGSGTRQVELFINGVTQGTSVAFDDADDKDDYTFTVNDINIAGDIIIEIRNISSKQVIVDDITWSSYSSGATTTWNGSESPDWATAANWDTNTVPTASDNVVIPDVTNAPVISSSTSATSNNLTITEPDGVTINSGGTLIVNGTSTGNVTYNNNLATTNWYSVSSPVSGAMYNTTWVDDNNIDTTNGTGDNIGISTYTTSDDSFSYIQTGDSGSFDSGKGYTVKQDANGTLAFTGTINTSDVPVSVVTGGNGGFNLIGNPFTAHLNSAAFLTDNTDDLVSQTIWVWNQATGVYETKITGDNFILAPTQGFFVSANASTNLNMAESYQTTTGGTFQKNAKTEVKLLMTESKNNRFAKIYYTANATLGFDNGYDGETFGGISNSIDVFTQLLSNDSGKKYQIQSLPNSNHENMVIPVGVKVATNKEISFSVEALNLPADINVYLEDRLTNTFTKLNEVNSSYKVTSDVALDGIGRFYLHTKTRSALSVDTVNMDNISIYKTTNSNLRVVGISQGKASIKLYSILGKQVFENSFASNGVQDITLPALSSGIYIVQLETETGSLNKKITLE